MRIFHPWVRQNLLRKTILFIILTLAVAGLVVWRYDSGTNSPVVTLKPAGQSTPSDNQAPNPFDKQQYSINDPTSLWVVVNKGRVLPSDYTPALVTPKVSTYYSAAADDSHLRSDAASALEELVAGAKAAGYNLRLYSGYRSYNNQVATYNGYVKTDGAAKADSYSARPGHSEHQTGLAADVSTASGKCDVQICFGDLPEGKWLAAYAYKYGFIIRYGKDQQTLTGYQYEPWHLRYVGKSLADQIHQTGQTLEQFFGLPAASTYPAKSYQLKVGA